MNFKKVSALALASMMAVSCASIAFASGSSSSSSSKPTITGNAITLKGSVSAQSMEVDVTLPTVTTLALDPAMVGDPADNPQSKQIYSDDMFFINNSKVDLEVKLAGYNINDLGGADSKTSSGIEVKSAAIGADYTGDDKGVYVYILQGTGAAAKVDSGAAVIDDTKTVTYDTTKVDENLVLKEKKETAYVAGNEESFQKLDKAVSLGTMTKAEYQAGASEGDPETLKTAGGVVAIKILGDMNPNNVWKAGDTLSVTPIFDIAKAPAKSGT